MIKLHWIFYMVVTISVLIGCQGQRDAGSEYEHKMDASLRSAILQAERDNTDERIQVLIQINQTLDDSIRGVFIENNIEIQTVVDRIITVSGYAAGYQAIASQPFIESMSLSQDRKPL